MSTALCKGFVKGVSGLLCWSLLQLVLEILPLCSIPQGDKDGLPPFGGPTTAALLLLTTQSPPHPDVASGVLGWCFTRLHLSPSSVGRCVPPSDSAHPYCHRHNLTSTCPHNPRGYAFDAHAACCPKATVRSNGRANTEAQQCCPSFGSSGVNRPACAAGRTWRQSRDGLS